MCTPSFKKFGFPSFVDQVSGQADIPRELFRRTKTTGIVDTVIQPARDFVASRRAKQSKPSSASPSSASAASPTRSSGGRTSLHVRNR